MVEHPEVTHFVLLFEGRTGSSYLISMLAAHPEIVAESEPLVGRNGEEQRNLLREFFSLERAPEIRVVGLKTKLRDIADPDFFRELLAELQAKVIHMERTNIIKLAISRLNARRLFQVRGIWNLRKGEAPLPPFAPSPIEVDESILFNAAKNRNLQEYIATLKRPLLHVTYESLLEAPGVTLQRTYDFLGVRYEFSVEASVEKNTSDDLRKVLLNYEELRAHYRGTPYENMF